MSGLARRITTGLPAALPIFAVLIIGIHAAEVPENDWWSLRPIARPAVPSLDKSESTRARTPIDAFVIAAHREHGLVLSPEADRRTLIRRAHYDLLGLPPSPERVEAFMQDEDPMAYEKLIDELLASPHYGERWARHWLDVVHYGDTHGYDKDKLRPHAWPYRDYVVRALNGDKRYDRFVTEQLAGDVLYPGTVDGITAMGFIAAGPWDFIGHVEIPETKIDGRIARHLDRDDMVSSTMTTFLSTTASCARCHDHKFDPVTMDDYYSLQAVFAALDRSDRPYDVDPEIGARRQDLLRRRLPLQGEWTEAEQRGRERAGPRLVDLERQVRRLERKRAQSKAYGYHSSVESSADTVKWVQVDLGRVIDLNSIVVVAAYDDFAGIGAGFGFPLRYRIDVSSDATFAADVETVVDHTTHDVANPGCAPQKFLVGKPARYIRVTATRLPRRDINDFAFALGEIMAHAGESGGNVARRATVTALDSIEQDVRWKKANLVDGVHFTGVLENVDGLAQARDELDAFRRQVTDEKTARQLERASNQLGEIDRELETLPLPSFVYAGTVHRGGGSFRGTGHEGGRPREIHVLHRGDVKNPGKLVGPGTIPVVPGTPARFELGEKHTEGERRRALAKWIVDSGNPLTWRSIVNRIWQYHFGRGIAATSNDFGRMGAVPTHPELLDWLAAEFRDSRQSIKRLHRLIMTSAVYRQSSASNEDFVRVDGSNRYLWRMTRRRMTAEEIRDSVLAVSGRLDSTMGGPGFQAFVLERPENSPHYLYEKHDPNAPDTHRRAIYRFITRSRQDPFMTTLDCADPSQAVARRDETLTALQALALFNDKFMIAMSGHFARRAANQSERLEEQIDFAWRIALQRRLEDVERAELAAVAREVGLVNGCRSIFNLSEFVFVD